MNCELSPKNPIIKGKWTNRWFMLKVKITKTQWRDFTGTEVQRVTRTGISLEYQRITNIVNISVHRLVKICSPTSHSCLFQFHFFKYCTRQSYWKHANKKTICKLTKENEIIIDVITYTPVWASRIEHCHSCRLNTCLNQC